MSLNNVAGIVVPCVSLCSRCAQVKNNNYNNKTVFMFKSRSEQSCVEFACSTCGSRFSVFLPQSQDKQFRLIGDYGVM